MTPKEKEALVDLLNAHTNKIAQLIGHGGKMPMWLTENVNNAIAHCEREFLTEPEEITT